MNSLIDPYEKKISELESSISEKNTELLVLKNAYVNMENELKNTLKKNANQAKDINKKFESEQKNIEERIKELDIYVYFNIIFISWLDNIDNNFYYFNLQIKEWW